MPTRFGRVRRRCESMLEQLDPPRPFSLEALCRRMEAHRGRPLHLQPLPAKTALSGVCGLWLATDREDFVFYEQRTVRSHQEHIVLHEIGHMLFEHRSLAWDKVAAPAALLPDLSPSLIQRLLTRTDYTTREEQEAEMFASVLRTRLARFGEPERPAGAADLNQLEAALGVGKVRGR